MKKAALFRTAAVWLIVMLIILATVGGIMFAKYLTTVNGADSNDIADWNFKVNGNVANSDTCSLTLEPKKYTNVKDGQIAPGTSGSFTISCSNSSTVDAIYKFSFEATEKPQNLKFYYDSEFKEELFENQGLYKYNFEKAGTENDGKLLVESGAPAANKEEVVTVYWNWPFYSGDDYADTRDQGKQLTVKITVTGQQLTPLSQ